MTPIYFYFLFFNNYHDLPVLPLKLTIGAQTPLTGPPGLRAFMNNKPESIKYLVFELNRTILILLQ